MDPEGSRHALAAAFTSAANSFQDAVRQRGQVPAQAVIGGQNVRFRFAGPELAATLMPAISHLVAESEREPETERAPQAGRSQVPGPNRQPGGPNRQPGGPNRQPAEPANQLTIDVWESSQSPVRMATDAWNGTVSPSQAIRADDFFYCRPDIGMLVLFQGRRALVCHRDRTEIPPWELAIPFRVVFNSWFQRQGGQVIHGAAVGDDRHALLLAGVGGAGKSSTALSCLDHPELYYLADDLCLLTREPHPVVHSLYNTIKIREPNLERFQDMDLPGLDHLPLDHGKPTFFLHPRYRQKLALQRPVAAILLPRITHRSQTQIVPAPASDAWKALVPSTFAVVMGNRRTAAENMLRLTHSLPVYWLELGTNRRQIADALHRFLAESLRQAA